jgi:hypothetical protein
MTSSISHVRGRAFIATALAAVLALSLAPAHGAGDERTGGSDVNRSGGSAGVGGGANQGVMTGDVPWCVPLTNKGGFWHPRPYRDNDYFLAPFPGCAGHDWTVALKNCFTGYMVWRFYGTLRPGDAARVVTRSRVEVPRWCGEGYEQTADFFFPNTTDVTGELATTVDGARADFGFHVWGSEYNNRTVVQTSEGVVTSGPATILQGDCTQPLIDLPNWFRTSVERNGSGARRSLFERYNATRRATGSAETARLDINAVTVPRRAEDVRFGSTGDCSSIYDYQGYLVDPAADAQTRRDNTVVVGTCAIPLERVGRVYTGRNNYAFFNDTVLDGKLGERYSMAKFPYGLAEDGVTAQYKKAVKESAFGAGLPLSPRPWPRDGAVARYGSGAWDREEILDPALMAKFVRCDYQSLAPQADLIGCEYTTGGCVNFVADTRDRGSSSEVYVEVKATLPRFYTASGELKVFRIPTTGRVLCSGRPCGSEPLDPRIISWDYSAKLVGEGGYRVCASKRQRGCDFTTEQAGRNGLATGTFFSPTSKGERVRLLVESTVTFARRVEREREVCETLTFTDPITGETQGDGVCYTEIVVEELAPETVSAHKIIPGDTSRTVTGSIGS